MGSVRQHLTLKEVAGRLSVSVSTVRREIARGRLKPRHVGHQLRIDEAHLQVYLVTRTGTGQFTHEAFSEETEHRRGGVEGQARASQGGLCPVNPVTPPILNLIEAGASETPVQALAATASRPMVPDSPGCDGMFEGVVRRGQGHAATGSGESRSRQGHDAQYCTAETMGTSVGAIPAATPISIEASK